MIVAACLCSLACGGAGVQGTYSNDDGAVTLELHSGGKAVFTFMGDPTSCTYAVDGQELALDCGQEKLAFTIHDGSPSGPPNNFIGALRKSKS